MFDLDHTLIHSPLDLTAMARDMQAYLETATGPLPHRAERYRVGELIAWCRRREAALEEALWAIALAHERHALGQATPESGALDALTGVRAAGWRTALWTNNAREVTAAVLARWGLDPLLDVVVSREDMRALKPDPDGWWIIRAALGAERAVMVGDSWVDGLAAAAAGLPFVAYRPDARALARWGIQPWATLVDLRTLPAQLAILDGRDEHGAVRGLEPTP